MPQKPSATLVAEVGSVTTRVTLVDTVDGEARLIGQASVPSTTEPPYENAVIGILEAATQLSEATGRQLMRDGSLLMPQTPERDGVDTVIGVTSAGAPMGVVIAAVSSEVSARSALRASRATYTNILQIVTLDDAAGVSAGNDSSWIERQVQLLLSLQPDLVIIAGGLEDGATDSLVRLAHIVGLTAFSSRIDADGQHRPGYRPPRGDLRRQQPIARAGDRGAFGPRRPEPGGKRSPVAGGRAARTCAPGDCQALQRHISAQCPRRSGAAPPFQGATQHQLRCDRPDHALHRRARWPRYAGAGLRLGQQRGLSGQPGALFAGDSRRHRHRLWHRRRAGRIERRGDRALAAVPDQRARLDPLAAQQNAAPADAAGDARRCAD